VSVVHAVVTDQPLDPESLRALVIDPAHGAEVLFVGTIRNHDGGRGVATLEYEIHPSAPEVLPELAEIVAAAYPAARLAVAHRYGPVPIGDAAFVVAAASAHRDTAFDAARELVETVKEKLPIWKRQTFTDGTHEWVNSA
jgi:molybdopterin synthase catalytic subunit